MPQADLKQASCSQPVLGTWLLPLWYLLPFYHPCTAFIEKMRIVVSSITQPHIFDFVNYLQWSLLPCALVQSFLIYTRNSLVFLKISKLLRNFLGLLMFSASKVVVSSFIIVFPISYSQDIIHFVLFHSHFREIIGSPSHLILFFFVMVEGGC